MEFKAIWYPVKCTNLATGNEKFLFTIRFALEYELIK